MAWVLVCVHHFPAFHVQYMYVPYLPSVCHSEHLREKQNPGIPSKWKIAYDDDKTVHFYEMYRWELAKLKFPEVLPRKLEVMGHLHLAS